MLFELYMLVYSEFYSNISSVFVLMKNMLFNLVYSISFYAIIYNCWSSYGVENQRGLREVHLLLHVLPKHAATNYSGSHNNDNSRNSVMKLDIHIYNDFNCAIAGNRRLFAQNVKLSDFFLLYIAFRCQFSSCLFLEWKYQTNSRNVLVS